jgi:hypothetical protein
MQAEYTIEFTGELRLTADDEAQARIVAEDIIVLLIGTGSNLEQAREKIARYNVRFANLGITNE